MTYSCYPVGNRSRDPFVFVCFIWDGTPWMWDLLLRLLVIYLHKNFIVHHCEETSFHFVQLLCHSHVIFWRDFSTINPSLKLFHFHTRYLYVFSSQIFSLSIVHVSGVRLSYNSVVFTCVTLNSNRLSFLPCPNSPSVPVYYWNVLNTKTRSDHP